MCGAPSTPTTSHSSDWSASSDSSQPSFPDSRIIFTQSASKQGWSKDDFGNGPVSDSTALANEVTPPDQHLVQAAMRPTSHNNTIALHTGFLTQALQSASANRCLDIIKALQGPFYHKLVSQIVFVVLIFINYRRVLTMLHLKNTTLYHSLYLRITGIIFLQSR
jgi:hypothetical protein